MNPKDVPDGLIDMLLVSHLFAQMDFMPLDTLEVIRDELSARIGKRVPAQVGNYKDIPHLPEMMDFVEEAAERHGHKVSVWKFSVGESRTEFTCPDCGQVIGLSFAKDGEGKVHLESYGPYGTPCVKISDHTYAVIEDVVEHAQELGHLCEFVDMDGQIGVECDNCGKSTVIGRDGNMVTDELNSQCGGGEVVKD